MPEYVYRGIKIELLGHASVRAEGEGVVVYVDPFQIRRARRDGDIVVCTHEHYDHCSPRDIERVLKEGGTIVAAANCEAKLREFAVEKVFLKPGETAEIGRVKIDAVPAYNVAKPFHPREYGGVGVVLTIGGVRIYHAGDTDFIPEMGELGEIDVALLPVGGTYTMGPLDAARAVEVIKPKVAIPMHYGAIVGSRREAEEFEKRASKFCEVRILL